MYRSPPGGHSESAASFCKMMGMGTVHHGDEDDDEEVEPAPLATDAPLLIAKNGGTPGEHPTA